MKQPEKPEYRLLAAVLLLLAIGVWGPFVAQPAHQHDFADQRFWGTIPFAMDVLSNLPFALWGALGLGCVAALVWQKRLPERFRGGAHNGVELGLAALFFAGLLATAVASSCYHWLPNDSGLAIDRLGMSIAFAGLLGLAAAGRISRRAGLVLGCAVLVSGYWSVRVWAADGNILPWALVQFGGMAMVLWLACLKRLPGALPVRWGLVIVVYAAAKLLELGDHLIFDMTAHAVSGHSLKHVVASFAAWPVLDALGVWAKTCYSTPPGELQRQKISAECLSLVQRLSSMPLSGELHVPQTLPACRTDKNRSQT